jgi:ABC-type transport system substrate-binding protein/signal transduction histidine kinase
MGPRHLDIATFSVDPPALEMFHGLDPESYLIVSALADPLVYIDEAGALQPALATSWEQITPTTWRFVLRRGVRFHDGSPLDADDVIATFAEHFRADDPTVVARSALSMIRSFRKLSDYEIELETHAPDSMLLRRLCFSHVYSRTLLAQGGREAARRQPAASGAFRLERWVPGVEIVLRRHEGHWCSQASVDTVRIPILRQKNWAQALLAGRVDVALGIDVHDKVRLDREPALETRSGNAAISHFFLLRPQGPLSNLRVRQALNHAVHSQLIVEIAEHGHGRAQRSIATPETVGYTPDVRTYVYNPELAQRILREEGYPGGFELRGLVSETSSAVYHIVKEFLARVGVRLNAQIVPRAEWISRIRGPKLRGEGDYDGDFALFVLDNPLLHSVFHQFVFLFSQGDWSFVHDPQYDGQFFQAATSVGEGCERALQELERYVADQAMILFTAQAQVHAASRRGIHFPLTRSGHFDAAFWWNLRWAPQIEAHAPLLVSATPDRAPEFRALLEGTGHLGTLYLPPDTPFGHPAAARVWQNLDATQQRWEAQLAPMVRELVTQAETQTHLLNVLGSTERVVICGVGDDGRRLFVNEGYRRMVGEVPPQELLGALWPEVTRQVDEQGSWSGPVRLARVDGGSPEFHLTASRARDPQQIAVGYTLVFTDFSGEEERIRSQAVSALVDNVSFGLFRCTREGTVLPGYSAACHELFGGDDLVGRPLVELLGLQGQAASEMSMLYEQIIDDLLPEEVNIGQFPRRVLARGRYLGLSPAPLRDEGGQITSVLFSMLDETGLVEAERNHEQLRGVVNVLQHRDSFLSLVRYAASTSDALLSSHVEGDEGWQVLARRFVHTCKGAVAQFGLLPLARGLHELEEAPVLGPQTIGEVRERLRALLAQHAEVWRMSFEDPTSETRLQQRDLERLRADIDSARTLEEAKAAVRAWTERMGQKTVAELVGPLQNAIEQQAERRGKQVRFVLRGGEVVLPPAHGEIVGALTHLVRNAVDHGIEEPWEREEKAPVASLTVEFASERGWVRCTVTDDGRGIDRQRLVHKAVERGLLTSLQAETISPDDALQLVFADGLSSADAVSETSGRGVGMSAVRGIVEKLGGDVVLRSTAGLGTRIELSWPG